MQRQFTSGSRQAPDPFDQFLEEHQFYRKHTARDASCLFRVLSEQMYDTQLHHLVIREKCVDYMRKHRKFFEANVKDRDFDEYLDDLSKPKTYGTLLELQAAGYLFQRNVLLFEPFNLGNYFNEYRAYFPDVFRVFYTPERHFDSVFTAEYIEEAAICQSIVYEILYKDFFKLPDVLFAVEQMLHGPSIENVDYRTETNQDGYGTRIHMSDGRIFDMDLPFNTNCILENHKLCHFHFVNFPKFFEDLKAHNANDVDKNAMVIQQSFLPNKYVSCVRQLLQEGITPFPYKVAKALDPNMYRNIEFDSWNELRKEAKLQNWYNGDNNFKVGAKCHVKLKSEQDLYTCHIQEIAMDKGQCVVFIEQLGEKRLVSYENLTPLPPDQFKPWTIPYRFQRQMHKYSSIRFTRHFNNRVKFNGGSNHHHYPFCSAAIESETCGGNFCINDDDPKRKLHHHHHEHYSTNTASFYKLKQYTQLENFHHTRTVEYCTMPLTVEHQHNVKSDIAGQAKESSNNTQEQTLTNLNSNDNSNAPSRSPSTGVLVESIATTIKTEPNTDPVNDIEQDHINVLTANNAPHMLEQYEFDPHNMGATLYMPDSQGFYTMYPPYAAAMPDDYYGGYCIDAGAYHPGSTAFMPTLNGANGAPLYYVCNGPPPPVTANGNFTPGNAFMNMPPPAPQNFGLQTAPPHMLNPNGAASYYSQYPPSTPTIINNSCQQISETTTTTAVSVTSASAASSGRQTPSTRYPRSGHSSTQITPLSCRRINFDAKKSSKTNGVDLPTDIVTLRHFYNLGLEYYHKHLKRNDNEQSAVNSDSNNNSTHNANNNEQHCDDLSNDVQNIRLDENANQIEKSKPDGNNNNIPSSLTNSADGFQSSDARPNSTNNAQNVNNCNSKNSKPTNEKNAHYSSGQGNSGGCGNAAPSHRGNNFRRYNARYFNKTDRSGQQQQNHHANQRYNSSTQQQQQHHQQQQLQQTQGSQNCKTLSSNNSNNKSQDSNTTNNSTPITSRVYQSQQSRQQHQQQQHQPQQQHQQQQQQHQHQHQHQQHQQQQQQHQQQHQSQSLQVEQFVQTSPMYGFEHLPADPMNANNVQTQTSSASNNSSHFNNHPLYIPMNMAGPPPPPPYFSTHPPPSMPPPCGPPPNALENLEFSPMEIPPPQAGNHPGMHSPYGAPTSGHISFPPPPTSIPMFYCSPNGVPLTPGPAELMNQPHLPPQGYLCLPPPPHQLAPPHQMQQAALNNNRTPLPNSNVLPAQSPVSNKPQGTSGITTDQRV